MFVKKEPIMASYIKRVRRTVVENIITPLNKDTIWDYTEQELMERYRELKSCGHPSDPREEVYRAMMVLCCHSKDREFVFDLLGLELGLKNRTWT